MSGHHNSSCAKYGHEWGPSYRMCVECGAMTRADQYLPTAGSFRNGGPTMNPEPDRTRQDAPGSAHPHDTTPGTSGDQIAKGAKPRDDGRLRFGRATAHDAGAMFVHFGWYMAVSRESNRTPGLFEATIHGGAADKLRVHGTGSTRQAALDHLRAQVREVADELAGLIAGTAPEGGAK